MKYPAKKFRLRLNNHIIGYAERTEHGLVFRKKTENTEAFQETKYNNIDEAVGIKDNLHRDIFEMDIVRYKINDDIVVRQGVVLWDNYKKSFGIFDVDSQHFTYLFIDELCLFETDKLEVVSHVFNDPELRNRLGLSK